MATNFALTTNSPQVNIIQSLNYLLSTQGNSSSTTANVNYNGNVLVANTVTGTISGVTSTGQAQTNTISYLYGYIDVAYANTATGGGFTSNCTNQQYFGVHNSQTPTFDTNPVDYQWTRVSGGFGTNKYLYYTTSGGNTINFSIGSAPPSIYYSAVIDSTPILLASLANSIVTTTSILPGAIVGNVISANTITGYNVQVGSLYANLFVANTIFVNQSIQSSNATFGSPTSAGFWLASGNGNARFGGNISIGNNLTVGNNAVIGGFASIGSNVSIGGNLNVAGLITAGSLQTNTVQTTTIIPNNVSTSVFNSTLLQQSYTNISQYSPCYYTYQAASITPTLANQQVLVTVSANIDLELGGLGMAQPFLQGQLIMSYVASGTTQYVQLAILRLYPALASTTGGNSYFDGSVLLTAGVVLPQTVAGSPLYTSYSFFLGLQYLQPYSSSNLLTFNGGTVTIQNLYR